MKRASYREAIEWMVLNDDTEFLLDEDPIPSVTALFTADLFGVDQEKVIADLRRSRKKHSVK